MKPKKVPLRMCVGCQTMHPKKELIRVVRTPDGEVLIDPTGKKAGRGAYLCAQVACLEQAVKRKSLQRALEHDLPEEVVNSLKARLIPSES
ncbi:MAG: RNase P modulator RnpM [Bacillota bacterium]